MTPPFERGTPEICAESLYSKSVNYFGPTLYNVIVGRNNLCRLPHPLMHFTIMVYTKIQNRNLGNLHMRKRPHMDIFHTTFDTFVKQHRKKCR
jgi:hypothetical protein